MSGKNYVKAVRRPVRIAHLHRDNPFARLKPSIDTSVARSLPPVLVLTGWLDDECVERHRMLLLDGNHRVGSAEARGEKTIDAWAVQWSELREVWGADHLPLFYSALDHLIICGPSGKRKKSATTYDREESGSC